MVVLLKGQNGFKTLKTPLPKPLGYPSRISTIGEHIKAKRMDLRLLQSELAEILDLDETTIHNWECGHTSPNIKMYPRIISFLGYHPRYDNAGTVGCYVKGYREAHGLTSQELADRIKVDQRSIARFERNYPTSYPSVWKKISKLIPELKRFAPSFTQS